MRTVAEGLCSVAALTRIPLVNNHLDCHLASPHAARAFLLVRSCRKPPMAAFTVDRERRWDPEPRRRLFLFLNLAFSDSQFADLIELNRLQARISNWQSFTGYGVAGAKLMSGVSAFSHAYEKLSGFASDAPRTLNA